MTLTSPRQVTSGYYRNHLYVLLGLAALATMAASSAPERLSLAPALLAAVLSYLGSVVWLYDKHRWGVAILALLSAVNLWGAWAATSWTQAVTLPQRMIATLDPLSG